MQTDAEQRDEASSSAQVEPRGVQEGAVDRAFLDMRPETVAQHRHRNLANSSARLDQQRLGIEAVQRKADEAHVTPNRNGSPGSVKLGIDSSTAIGVDHSTMPAALPEIQKIQATVQRRTISGNMITAKKEGLWGVRFRGTSDPGNANLATLSVLVGRKQKRILQGVDGLMRAHLVKAAWDNNNDEENVTQWRTRDEEVKWASVEAAAEKKAAELAAVKGKNKKNREYEYKVETSTDDLDIGNKILGLENDHIKVSWLKKAVKNAGNANIVNDARNELNRMVTASEMKVDGDVVGNITSEAHEGIGVSDS